MRFLKKRPDNYCGAQGLAGDGGAAAAAKRTRSKLAKEFIAKVTEVNEQARAS